MFFLDAKMKKNIIYWDCSGDLLFDLEKDGYLVLINSTAYEVYETGAYALNTYTL